MITVKNYLQEREKINFEQIPDKFKKIDEFILEALDFYGEDSEIDKTIDKGIKQLNELHVSKAPDKVVTKEFKDQKLERIRLATSPVLNGITKIISEYYGGSTITLKRVSEKSKEFEVFNKNGIIASAIVLWENDRYTFYQYASKALKEKLKVEDKVLSNDIHYEKNQVEITKIPSFIKIADVHNDKIRAILEKNKPYFEQIQAGIIGVKEIKFGNEDGIIFMETYAKDGRKGAKYYVHSDNQLSIKKEAQEITPAENKSGKVELDYIRIEWAEGDQSKYDKFPKEYKSWEAANKAVLPMLEKDIGGYNKCKFEVMFKDGDTYTGRLDVSEKEDNPENTTNVFGDHIFEYLNWLVNNPKSKEPEAGKDEIRKYLKTYDLGPGTRNELNIVKSGYKVGDIMESPSGNYNVKILEIWEGYEAGNSSRPVVFAKVQRVKENGQLAKSESPRKIIIEFKYENWERSPETAPADVVTIENFTGPEERITKEDRDFAEKVKAKDQAKKETEEKKPTPEEVAAQKAEYKKEVEAELHKITSGGEMSMQQVVTEGRRINELRSFRSQFIDNGSDNKRRLTPTKENLARWINAPGRFDLIGVDTASKTDATADLKHVKKETIFHLIGINK